MLRRNLQSEPSHNILGRMTSNSNMKLNCKATYYQNSSWEITMKSIKNKSAISLGNFKTPFSVKDRNQGEKISKVKEVGLFLKAASRI